MPLILDFLFPKTCIGCQKQGDYMCKKCKKTLTAFPEICPICGKFSKDYNTCIDCKSQERPNIKGLMITFVYSDFLKKLILKLKYQHKKDISNFLAQRLSLLISINQEIQRDIEQTAISYIPSHRYRKHFIKGYNQSELLAEETAEISGIHFFDILKKQRNTRSQVGLTKQQREQNLKSAFVWIDDFDKEKFKNMKNLIVIDDITTTGATIQEIAGIIKTKYPKLNIYGCVVGKRK